ncbi:MAG: M23 family metallopeptidase [Oscillatoria princeps RMCB-10]|jgi:murein DD-endopeptidase MepM/ murein hydrolase activator NlpD|nr:M23 family metallopeptidase [Oscillatoria princeps RMCB-10]
MIALSRKHLFTFLLALTLASLPSCFQQGKTTVAQPPAAQTPVTVAQAGDSPSFAIPIDCTLGQDCFILSYFDRAPGPEYVDFGCGRQTYDGHNGTDFGIPDEQAMARGVAVKASAAGKVLRVRDGIADRRMQAMEEAAQLKGIECGNGAVIDHGNGWQSQYCHMRQGSVAVKPGMQVEKGTVLGMVGMSGLASYPHVHLTLRYGGKPVDPFVGVDAAAGCQVERRPLWEPNLEYAGTGLIKAGFSSQPPGDINTLWNGSFSETPVSTDSPVLIFWAHSFGVLKGDLEHFRLLAPDGTTIAESKREIQSPNRINWSSYVGKKNTKERPLTPGVWRGEYQLVRGERVLIDLKQEVELK